MGLLGGRYFTFPKVTMVNNLARHTKISFCVPAQIRNGGGLTLNMYEEPVESKERGCISEFDFLIYSPSASGVKLLPWLGT